MRKVSARERIEFWSPMVAGALFGLFAPTWAVFIVVVLCVGIAIICALRDNSSI